MITWVTVWVLTVTTDRYQLNQPNTYQLTYATQSICEKQGSKLDTIRSRHTCNFQQVPIYLPKDSK